MIGALGYNGLRCGYMWEGYVDDEAFRHFIDELIKTLKPGDIVVWDNYSVHKNGEHIRRINEVGATVTFLPPYSPELSPIEECWSKVKHIMRNFAATCADGLWEAFCTALDAITPSDAKGWFHHCGYRPISM